MFDYWRVPRCIKSRVLAHMLHDFSYPTHIWVIFLLNLCLKIHGACGQVILIVKHIKLRLKLPRPVTQLNLKPPCSSPFWDCVQGSLGNRHHAWPRCTGSYTQLPASLPAVKVKRRRFGDTHDERYGFTHGHGHPRIESIYLSIHPSIHVGTVCGYCMWVLYVGGVCRFVSVRVVCECVCVCMVVYVCSRVPKHFHAIAYVYLLHTHTHTRINTYIYIYIVICVYIYIHPFYISYILISCHIWHVVLHGVFQKKGVLQTSTNPMVLFST